MKFDGNKLKNIRNEHGLAMVDLVTKLGITNQSYISQIEKGVRNPRPNISKRIAETLLDFAEKEKSPDTDRAILETFLDSVVVSNSKIIITLNLGNCWWRRTESSGIPKNLLLLEYQKPLRH